MRLPVKFQPRLGQMIAEVVGSAIITVFGVGLLGQYASPSELRRYHSFGEYLHTAGVQLPFLVLSAGFCLCGLGWFTVALLNLLAGSPFNYLIVDRFGLTYRNFWGEKRFSWKELGPIQPLRLSLMRARGNQLRYWIAADTVGGAAGGDMWLWTGLAGANLRIPAATFVGSGWLIGSIALATDDAANWLEELRQLARIDRLGPEDIPPPPAALRAPLEVEYGDEDFAPSPVPGDAAPVPGTTPTVER